MTSNVRKSLFGGSESKTKQRLSIIPRTPPVIPRIGTAGGSFLRATPTFTAAGTQGDASIPGQDLTGLGIDVGLAPEIAQLREEALTGRRGLIGDIEGDIESLRGIQNPFVQARVAPFVAERERAARDATRRGIAGPLSALATNPFTARIAEQQALATSDVQGAIRAGQQQIQSLLGDVSGEGRAMMEEELQLLGLSQQQIRDVVASQLQRQAQTLTESTSEQEGGVVPGVSGAFSALFPGGL